MSPDGTSQERELAQLKSVLRSLVVSCPTQVDVRSLLRDYRSMVGAHLPWTRFGYRDAIAFLRERCADCFLFQGPAHNPVLTLIVPDELLHIDQFVQKQKIPSTHKAKGKRRSVPESVARVAERDLISKTFAQRNSKAYRRPEAQPRADEKRPATDLKRPTADVEALPRTRSQDVAARRAEGEDQPCALTNLLRKKATLRHSPDRDDDSGRHSASSASSARRVQLEELQGEVVALVRGAAAPVPAASLVRLYRERYGREVNFARFGFASIESVVWSVSDCVHVTHAPGGECLVSAVAPPGTSPPAAARPAPRPCAASRPAPRRAADPRDDSDDALPGIEFDPDVFPADCMHFMESVGGVSLANVEPGAMLEVVVGEVYSPSHFWLIQLGERYNLAMEDVMDQMTRYYGSGGAGADRSLALGAARVGHYCASVYERDWHRSLIVKQLDSDTVKVRHVDYGTVEAVDVTELKPLRREWAALPAQAVRAQLAGVRPSAGGRRWPRAAAAHFLRLVRDRRLVANVVAVDHQENVLEVILVDTSTEEDVQVGAELVRAGHADPRPDCALGTGECYLFPRFEALESGDTPNYAEIHQYLRDGIALEFVEEYRRHVPDCLNPPLPQHPLPPAPSSSASSSSTSPPCSPSPTPSPPPPELPRVALNRVPLQPISTATLPVPPRPISTPTPPSRPVSTPTPPSRSVSTPPGFSGPSSFPPHSNSQMFLSNFPNCPTSYASQTLPFFPPGYPIGPTELPFCPAISPYPQPALCPSFRPPPVRAFAVPPPYSARPLAPSPPPPYCGPRAEREVKLSGAQCQIFRTLSRTDVTLAHLYMMETLRSAETPASASPVALAHAAPAPPAPPVSTLNPEAAEFRLVSAQTQTEPEEPLVPLSPAGGAGNEADALQPAVRVFLARAALRPSHPPRPIRGASAAPPR